ncbi:MAG: nucleotidyltransferase domain-containing protein [Nanoarchaeota archaeon]
MDNKKPDSLISNLSSTRKYDPKIDDLNPSAKNQNNLDYNKLKTKLEGFKKKILKKFKFTKALAIIPQNLAYLFEEDEGLSKEIINSRPLHLLMIIPEEQYKNLQKIKAEVVNISKESGENLWVHIKSAEIDMWSYGLDSKFEFYDLFSSAFPIHDDGFLGALRLANVHKALVLNWLNVGRVHYVATYAIGGSLVRGNPDKTSDVDTFVIIDDTDVKRMSRVELIEKLRGKIVSEFVREATMISGVKNILNVQVYLLTDFWQSVKDAQPVMFTFIRDGVPLFDRGTFIPWKRLLQMGRIKPSPEAIDLYMKEGERTEELVKRRLLDAMIDIYYGVVTPTQSMMMLSGHAPPVPKTIVAEVKKVLVDEEKVMSEKELKTLEKVVKMFKDYEHGKLKDVKGHEIDSLISEFKEFNKKMKDLREKLEKRMQEHQANKMHEETLSAMKNALGSKNENDLVKKLENDLVKKGAISQRMLNIAKDALKVRQKIKGKVLSQGEMQKIIGNTAEFNDKLAEYSQRRELVNLENGKLKISYKDKKAEIINTIDGLYLIESKDKIYKIDELGNKLVESDLKQFENSLLKTKEKLKINLSSTALNILKNALGEFSINL